MQLDLLHYEQPEKLLGVQFLSFSTLHPNLFDLKAVAILAAWLQT